MADSMNLTGFKEMAEKLKELGPRIARNGLRQAVSTAAAMVRDDAVLRAPQDTGMMVTDIAIKRNREKKDATDLVASYSVFVRSGKKSRLHGKKENLDKNSFYWRFVEFGTSKMPARPFLRPAFEMNKEALVEAIGARLDKRIQAEVRKEARREAKAARAAAANT